MGARADSYAAVDARQPLLGDLQKSDLFEGETDDCSVVSLATATGISYDEAHAASRRLANRKRRRGTKTLKVIDGIGTLGFSATPLNWGKPSISAFRTRMHAGGGFYVLRQSPRFTGVLFICPGHAMAMDRTGHFFGIINPKARVTHAWAIHRLED